MSAREIPLPPESGWRYAPESRSVFTKDGYLVCVLDPAFADERGPIIAASPDLLTTLDECEELLDDLSDVRDGDDGQPRPNRAMHLLGVVRETIAKART